MKWIKKIEECENVNQLPSFNELNKIADEEDETEIFEEWSNNQGRKIIIKDGTVVVLGNTDHNCIAHGANKWMFYRVENTEIYICAQCRLWQKSYNDLKKEVGYDDDTKELLLPYEWNENGVKVHLKRELKKRKERELKAEIRSLARKERERLQYEGCDCCYCNHIKNSECEYSISNDGEECEDFEPR